MYVNQFMTRDVSTLSTNSSIKDALLVFLDKRIDIACVTDNQKLLGIVTKYSIYRALLNNLSLNSTITTSMIKSVVTINESASLYVARDTMLDANVSHAVILNNQQEVTGIMSKSNIIEGITSEVSIGVNRLQSLLENLQDAVILVDPDLNLTLLNNAAKDMFNFENIDLHQPIQNLFPQFIRPLRNTLINDKIIEAQRINLAEKTVIASFIPVKRLEKTEGAMVVFRDVTAYESIANELESTKILKETLNSAIELAYDGVVITDKFGKITMANQGFIQLYKFENTDDLIGNAISSIAPEIPADKSLVHFESIKAELIEINEQTCILTQTPIFQNDEMIGMISKIMFQQLDVWKSLFSRMSELENELTYYREEMNNLTDEHDYFESLISVSKKMNLLKKEASIGAKSQANILITGESGTGKGLIAEAIHEASNQKGKFLTVNCAAIPSELLESEFFGYEEGAFTGAKIGGKKGKFELAEGGTLFLDEIGDMPLTLQVKLLRVLQDKQFERVGGSETIHSDVRIITATNQKLFQLVKDDLFREDLYYRINVIQIHMPALRERLEDIPVLCDYFIQKFNRVMNKKIEGISDKALEYLKAFHWPGNIRQLENILERACIYADTDIIKVSNLPDSILLHSTELETLENNIEKKQTITDRKELIDDTEKMIIIDALRSASGNKSNAAKLLNISRSTLYQRIKKYEIKEVSVFKDINEFHNS